MTATPSSKHIREILIDEGVTQDIYIGEQPDEPNTVITIYDTGGRESNPKWRIDYPEIQVRVRDESYETAYSIINDIRGKILGKESIVKGDYVYVGFYTIGGIIAMPKDDKRRSSFVLNFSITREPLINDNRTQI